ncbi:MAG: hypothetical protein JWL81_1557 [Verrucomicrobiales bacterium]|nr:hypothetical protein [Verrucomicrobiales bacterium]
MSRRFLTTSSGIILAVALSACGKKEEPPVPPVPAPSTAAAPGPLDAPLSPVTVPPTPIPAPAPAAAEANADAQPAAIARFKAEVEVIKDFVEANQAATDPAAGLASLRELIKRAAAVRTEGLPEDLATAYQTMTAAMQRVQSALDDMPVPIDQLQSHLENQKQKSDAAGRELQAKIEAFKTTMEGLGKESEAASAKLKEVGAKYGIQSLELGPQ